MSGLTSPTHIAILLVVLLLVFGAKRLPELGRSLGHGLREFKDSVGGESLVEHSAAPSLGAAPMLTEDPPLRDRALRADRPRTPGANSNR